MRKRKPQKRKSARLRYIAMLLPVVVVLLGACLVQECGLELGAPLANKERQAGTPQATSRKWAEPVELPGVPNLHKVSDELYRGAQPSAEGMKQLEKIGIKTVVNLRFLLSDRDELKGTGLAYEHINVMTFYPETKDVVRFLKIVSDPSRTPVFVHCHQGADRTGMMCAVYRVAVQGWTKDEAIDEMTQGGFGHHPIWRNLPRFIRKLDIEKLKRAAGLSE